MKAKSINGTSPEELNTKLKEALEDGFSPTLAICFISVKQDRKAIRELLDKAGLTIFGATTNGGFRDDTMIEESAAILLLDIKPEFFHIQLEGYPEKNYREVAAMTAKKALEKIKNPVFLIAGSNIETDGEELIYGFEDVMGKEVELHGCMAGDDFTFTEQFVFTNEKESNRGLLVLALDGDKIEIKGKATCGWKAVGTVRTVTKSEGNHVYTVDDIPVLDLTIKYSGLEIDPSTGDFSVQMSSQFPLQLQRESGEAVMRPGLVVDLNDRSFHCVGSVPQGAKVRFSLPPDFDVIDKVIEACEDLKRTEMPDPDALIIFSCAGRLVALGPLMGDEIEGMRKVWEVPTVGMFSNAELARTPGGNIELHNLTTCAVVLKEK
ncbi:FIST signal transduction protein [Algoriphagus sediminis]|uniref:FIST N-terminal domain-containing protein n=1 Tax=Algoriphagus sediminis TaxID=3057113 RepID=A0ABT7YC40_9BACT|nr:FIST N-terminal domain-containing protein [Algoriphagus sediminis]MDN3204092.1 FIST N-terminal domain-containing protein [Algoriphagus sediminis]